MIDQDQFKAALDLAAWAHGPDVPQGRLEQRVPGTGFPYVVHVAKVAMEVQAATELETGLDRDLAIVCALLHDTVEDAATPDVARVVRHRIMAKFGHLVIAGVEALTKDSRIEDKGERMLDSLSRIRAQRREIWLVKLADRITNLEPAPAEWSTERRRAYLEESKTILRELGSASENLSRRLEEKIASYERDIEDDVQRQRFAEMQASMPVSPVSERTVLSVEIDARDMEAVELKPSGAICLAWDGAYAERQLAVPAPEIPKLRRFLAHEYVRMGKGIDLLTQGVSPEGLAEDTEEVIVQLAEKDPAVLLRLVQQLFATRLFWSEEDFAKALALHGIRFEQSRYSSQGSD